MSDVAASLPEQWAVATIADLIGVGGVFSDGDWVESEDQDPSGDVRLIQLADVGDGSYRDRSSRFLTSIKAAELRCTFLKPGDLLIARMPDPLGRACVYPGDEKASVTVVDVCIVRPQSPVCTRWLMHHLNTPQVRRVIAKLQSGTTRKRISRGNLATLKFPIPPVQEQVRIAARLDELLSDLDAGVKALEGVRAKLRLYRAAVLKAAVEGTLTFEWRKAHPDVEPASELLQRILAERRRRWEEAQLKKYKDAGKQPPKNWSEKYQEPVGPDDSIIQALPQGWCCATIEQLTTELSNGFGKRKQAEGVPHVVLRLADIVNGEITLAATRSVNCLPEESQRYGLSPLDVLFIRVNGSADLVGRIILVGETDKVILYCDHFIRGRMVLPFVSKWIRAYGDTQKFRRFVDQNKVSSAGQNTISQTSLETSVVCLPPLEEQEVIVDAVEDQLSTIDRLESDLEAKLRSATALRQSLLKAAFEGKLVPQDPNDEPASELLKRIAAERAERERLAKKAKKAAKPVKVRRPKHGQNMSAVSAG